LIPWCFKDLYSDLNLGRTINNAWETGTRTLGEASHANGHNLHFQRWVPLGLDYFPYCYESEGVWNPIMPPEALVVQYGGYYVDFDGIAVQGYRSDDLGLRPGRHKLTIGRAMNLEFTAAHELGHVFGLVHEHQRHDRDDHVIYACQNVYGFDEALERCVAAADGCTVESLCNDADVALRHNFAGHAFTKWPQALEFPSEYDKDSIMHYDSIHGANDHLYVQDPANPGLWPLYRVNRETMELEFLPIKGGLPYPDFNISPGDAAMIRAMYPFKP
jgi:hypothetical protein